jgi:LuxR family maltose regulon positive regulatory protein
VAAPSDAIRRFVRRGAAILDLLDALLARHRDSFAERVAAAVRSSLAQAGDKRQESLSPREREILRLMAEGRTAEETAELLCVAPSTVRSHVKAAYSKLGAHRKIDALNRARELGVL